MLLDVRLHTRHYSDNSVTAPLGLVSPFTAVRRHGLGGSPLPFRHHCGQRSKEPRLAVRLVKCTAGRIEPEGPREQAMRRRRSKRPRSGSPLRRGSPARAVHDGISCGSEVRTYYRIPAIQLSSTARAAAAGALHWDRPDLASIEASIESLRHYGDSLSAQGEGALCDREVYGQERHQAPRRQSEKGQRRQQERPVEERFHRG